MAFMFADDVVRGWADSLLHCELVVVSRPACEDMFLGDPDHVETVCYAKLERSW